MTDSIQIEVPPLRQSFHDVMGCPQFYVTSIIKGRKQPGGMESAQRRHRSTESLANMLRGALARASARTWQHLTIWPEGVRPTGRKDSVWTS